MLEYYFITLRQREMKEIAGQNRIVETLDF